MPLYYFHIEDGTPRGDPEGIDLPDAAAARRQAEHWFNALMAGSQAVLTDGDAWQVRVTDEAGHDCFSLQFAPAGPAVQGIHDYRLRAEHAFPD